MSVTSGIPWAYLLLTIRFGVGYSRNKRATWVWFLPEDDRAGISITPEHTLDRAACPLSDLRKYASGS